MDNIKSELVFEGYNIESIDYKSNPSFKDPGEPIELKYFINVGFMVNNDYHTRHKVEIEGIVFEGSEENNYPFSIKVKIAGFFDLINIPQDEVQNYLNYNAVSILLPYLRSTIAMITSLTGNASLNLPLINVHKLISNIGKQSPEVVSKN